MLPENPLDRLNKQMAERQAREMTPNPEHPLAGEVVVCIGGTRPKRSIGGPTSWALAKAGADVFITGNYPPKESKVKQVLDGLGDHALGHGAYNLLEVEQRQALIMQLADLQKQTGKRLNVLYFPAEGLLSGTDEEKEFKAHELNVVAAAEIASKLASIGIAKSFGIPPSIYSQNPDEELPDDRYAPVAKTKHEGELALHALIPDFEKTDMTLFYISAHGVEGTFAMDAMSRAISDEKEKQLLASAEVGGEHRLTRIDEMAQGVVNAVVKVARGEMPQGGTEFVGIAEHARRQIETHHFESEEIARRLDIYGPEAIMIDDITIHGEGRRAIARMITEGEPVRPILNDTFTVDSQWCGHYTVTEDDTRGHFRNAPEEELRELFQGIKMLALMRQTGQTVLDRSGETRYGAHVIEEIQFKRVVYPGEALESYVQFVNSRAGTKIAEARVTTPEGELVASATIEYTSITGAPEYTEHSVAPEYHIESAAHTALQAGMVRQGIETMEGLSPLFAGIEQIRIHRNALRGANVTVDVTTTSDGKGIAGSAVTYDEHGPLIEVIGMSGPIGPRKLMNRMAERTRKAA